MDALQIEINALKDYRRMLIARRIAVLEYEMEINQPLEFKGMTYNTRAYRSGIDATPENSEAWARECNPSLVN